MKNFRILPTYVGLGAVALMLSGCLVSKGETMSQLQRHMSAYEKLKITPGNANSTLKSISTLRSSTKGNSFVKYISTTQDSTLNKAKNRAETVLQCMKTAVTAKEKLSSNSWNIASIEKTSSTFLKSRLEEVSSAQQCEKDVENLMSRDEGEKLALLAKETLAKYELVLKREKAAEMAKAAKEKARLAEEERVRCSRFGDLSTQSNQAAHSIEAQGCMTKDQAIEFYVKNPSICTTYRDSYEFVCKKVFEDLPGNIPGLHNPYR